MSRALLFVFVLLPGISFSLDWVERPIRGNFDYAIHTTAADFNGDGTLDVVGASLNDDQILLWLNTDGSGVLWEEHAVSDNFNGAYWVVAADVDGDTDNDIIGAGFTEDMIAWWENVGGTGENWEFHVIDDELNGANCVLACDFDNDGDVDLAGSAQYNDAVKWWENSDGAGSEWIEHVIDDNIDAIQNIHASDMDGDGDLDILGAAAGSENSVVIWTNNNNADNWTQTVVEGIPFNAESVSAGDINGDGVQDIAGASNVTDNIGWWEHLPDDTYVFHMIESECIGARSVWLDDIDGDADLDILGTSSHNSADLGDIVWWENNGTGTIWIEHRVSRRHTDATFARTVDINGDGVPDILAAACMRDRIIWWEQVESVPIEIESPIGGEDWPVATTQTIYWTYNTDTPVTIELYDDEELVSTIATDVANIGASDWTIPGLPVGDQYWIRLITCINDIPYWSDSPYPFSLTLPIRVLCPDGDEEWALGTEQTISWLFYPDCPITIDLYRNNYRVMQIAESIENEMQYSWLIPPLTLSDYYEVVVRAEYDGQEYVAESNETFSLIHPIEVLSPDEDDEVYITENYTILWESQIDQPVCISLYRDGELETVIVEETANDGVYSWNIRNVSIGDSYRFRVSTVVDEHEYYDDSDYELSILSPVEIEEPNGGEQWRIGTEENISWSRRLQCGATIDLYRNGEFYEHLGETPSQSRNFRWQIGALPVDYRYKIRVSIEVDGETYWDESASGFQLLPPMELTAPSGGETWLVGSQHTIQWDHYAGNLFNLSLILDGQIALSITPSGVPPSSYNWTIPGVDPSRFYSIRIYCHYGDIEYYQQMDNTFEITLDDYLISPNGDEEWAIGSVETIEWIPCTDNPVTLELRQNGDLSQILASDIENDGQYEWNLLGLELSDDYRIRVKTRINGHNYFDMSDRDFSIISPRFSFQQMWSDTTHPAYVSSIFLARRSNGRGGVSALNDLEYFEVLEDGEPVDRDLSVPLLSQKDSYPMVLNTLLMLDNSYSIGLDLEHLKEAARVAVRNKLDQQRFAIWTFSEDVNEIIPFTADTTELMAAIDEITVGLPSTDLYGAVVTGMNQWEDIYSGDGVDHGIMVLLSDGRDTQGSTSEEEARNAVNGRYVYSIALGEDADRNTLYQLGTIGYSFLEDPEQLPNVFTSVQAELEGFANSFYWFACLSSFRENDEHSIVLSVPSNPNHGSSSELEILFTSDGFTDLLPGVYLNRSVTSLTGISQYNFDHEQQQAIIGAATLLGEDSAAYTWSLADEEYFDLTSIGEHNEIAQLTLLATEPCSTSLIVQDTVNQFIQTIPVSYTWLSAGDHSPNLPGDYEITGIYPNPFNSTTLIQMYLPEPSFLRMKVYNLLGQPVETITSDFYQSGVQTFSFNGDGLASGIYFLHVEVPGRMDRLQKLYLIK